MTPSRARARLSSPASSAASASSSGRSLCPRRPADRRRAASSVASSPIAAGMTLAMRSRSQRERAGLAPPVATPTMTGPRSSTAANAMPPPSGRSARVTSAPAALAARSTSSLAASLAVAATTSHAPSTSYSAKSRRSTASSGSRRSGATGSMRMTFAPAARSRSTFSLPAAPPPTTTTSRSRTSTCSMSPMASDRNARRFRKSVKGQASPDQGWSQRVGRQRAERTCDGPGSRARREQKLASGELLVPKAAHQLKSIPWSRVCSARGAGGRARSSLVRTETCQACCWHASPGRCRSRSGVEGVEVLRRDLADTASAEGGADLVLGDPAVAPQRRALKSLARRLLQAPLQQLRERVGARLDPTAPASTFSSASLASASRAVPSTTRQRLATPARQRSSPASTRNSQVPGLRPLRRLPRILTSAFSVGRLGLEPSTLGLKVPCSTR